MKQNFSLVVLYRQVYNILTFFFTSIYLHTYWSSGVRALPVAAGTNEGGHYFRYFSFFPLFLGLPLLLHQKGLL